MLDLCHHFLIAMPCVDDEDFAKSVVYIFDHGKNGSAGLVINKPSESTLRQMFDRMHLSLRRTDLHSTPVFLGGPVFTDRGFVLHEAQLPVNPQSSDESFYTSTLTLHGGLEMTTSRDVLEALACGAGPAKIFISHGYAAWQAGQLEAEIKCNDWLITPAAPELIFDVPIQERYSAALALLGIDEMSLATLGGTA
jgi:putative transcriptional regulator